jgi:two-component system cell cycle sensor histidine kinase/response regulator CckA
MVAKKPSGSESSLAAATNEPIELSSESRNAVRTSQRIAIQLHQLIAASITVTALRSEIEILKSLAGSARIVFDADEAIVTLDTGSVAPLRGVARRGKRPLSEVPGDVDDEAFPTEWEVGSDTRVEGDWLVAPILERRDRARGVIAVRRGEALEFGDEDKEVLVLLAQMASSALGAAELGRTIQASESRLRVLIETAPVGIVEADIDGNVRWWNSSASKVFAWPDFADVDNSAAMTFPPSLLSGLHELWTEVRRGGAVDGRDFVDVEIAGRTRVLTASAALLPTSDGVTPAMLTLIDDVTNNRELIAELRHAHTMETRGQVASRIAHDFNNLLTLISGYAEILSSEITIGKKSKQMVNEIQTTASRASLLTGQLQAIGRTSDPEPVVFNPVAAIHANAEVLERILGTSIGLEWSLDENAGNVRADADQFEQMIMNLTMNARDAMPKGGTLSIRVAAQMVSIAQALELGIQAGNYVLLSVADDGVGMDEATRARCFDALFTTKGTFKGTGMGLASARRLAEESGGIISCRSTLGEGTTFEVLLPHVDEPVAATPTNVEVDRPRGSATVLIVDDDDGLRNFMSRILERNGYQIMTADSAEQALTVFDDFPGSIDLLVSDVVMGAMSGRELATTLQAKDTALSVLLVSGTANRSIIAELNPEASDFLAKPFQPSQLIDKVHEMMSRRP